MAKKTLTQATYPTNNIQNQPDQVVGQSVQLKLAFDQGDIDQKTYNNTVLLAELQAETAGSAGANAIGAEGTYGTNNVGDEIKAIKVVTDDLNTKDGQNVKITGNQTVNGTKTFGSNVNVPTTPTANAHATSKQYVDGLDAQNVKLTGNQTVAGIKTFSSSPVVPTPTADTQVANKAYVDDQAPLTIPNGSITDLKLSDDPDQIKAAVRNSDYLDANRVVGNTRLVNDYQSATGWSGASVVEDTVNKKIGSASLKFTTVNGSVTSTIDNLSPLDLTKLNNGETVLSGDFITALITGDHTIVSQVQLRLSSSATFDGSNYTRAFFNLDQTDWKTYAVKISDLADVGSGADLTNIQSIRLSFTATGVTDVNVQVNQLIKADPENPAIPNALQENGKRLRNPVSGEYYVGPEFGINKIKEIQATATVRNALQGVKSFKDCIIDTTFIATSTPTSPWTGFYVDSNNYILARISGDKLTLELNEAGSPSSEQADLPIDVGDRIQIVIKKSDNNINVFGSINGGVPVPISTTTTITASGNAVIGTINTVVTELVSTSITELPHADTANYASRAGSLDVVYKNGAFTVDELSWGTYGLDTANGDVYFKISSTQMIQLNGVIV